MGLSVIVLGNPFDGLSIVGPFATGDEANEWADLHASGEDWWCVALVAADENEWTQQTALAEEDT